MYLEFEDFLFDCESRKLSQKTIKSYRNNTALYEIKVITVFNDSEVNNLLNFYNYSDYLNARNKAILAFQFDTGARTTETIEVLNVDLQSDRVLIHGKGSKERFVPLSIELKKY